MSVDIEAIARECGCDQTSLKSAFPLIRQGYLPPYLARYRRDELSGIAEEPLWALYSAVQSERRLDERRDQLLESYNKTACGDHALQKAIEQSDSVRHLERLSRTVRVYNNTLDDASRLAVRVLNPQEGDSADVAAIAASMGLTDATARLSDSLKKLVVENQQIISAATDWIARNVKISIGEVKDLNAASEGSTDEEPASVESVAAEVASPSEVAGDDAQTAAEAPAEPNAQPEQTAPLGEGTPVAQPAEQATAEVTDATVESDTPQASEASVSDQTAEAAPADSGAQGTEAAATTEPQDAPEVAPATGESQGTNQAAEPPGATKAKSSKESEKQSSKQKKKVSPRQRRRRWLVGILEPLANKKLSTGKLSAFQILMLAKGLRSNVVTASFDYDRTKLMQFLEKTAKRINASLTIQIRDAIFASEAAICAAAEEAFWDRQLDRASARLQSVVANGFRSLVMRQPAQARGVIALDAVGPKTAALAVLNGEGDIVHTEDIPCQLTKALREQMVMKLGELCHRFHVDMIVVSNGPARRNCLIGLAELLEQSQPGSLHWTLSDRSGADLFASADASDPNIRRLPRRFRAAAWIGMQLIDPIGAYSKIDPSRLRLSSYQRELNSDALGDCLGQVLTSGISAKGADLNATHVDWLAKLPGVSGPTATEIDRRRRETLFTARSELKDLPELGEAERRQMVPFLRVFGGEQPLDATLIHPDDYTLAEKLAKSLEIPLPEATPPGYVAPDYSVPVEKPSTKPEEPSLEQSPVEPAENTDFGTMEGATSAEPQSSEDAAEAAAEPSPESEPTDTESVDATAPQENAETAASDTAEANSGEAPEATEPPEAEAPSDSQSEGDDESPAAEASTESSESQGDAAADGEASANDEAPAHQAAPTEAPPEMPKHPLPDQSKIAKVVKEWQVGAHRVRQIVNWLCEPYSIPSQSLAPQALMPTIPKLDQLKPGDLVSGVVVGVAKFGVFVELGPDCSGLIHVSRLSNGYVEDPHELVQVGDVVVAYVTAIESQRKRVALSVLSPQETEAAQQARNERSENRQQQRRGNNQRGPRREGGHRSSGPSGPGRGGGGGGKPGGGDRGGRRGKEAGPRGKRQRERGSGRSNEPRSFTVRSSKEPVSKISDNMKSGEEPLRSFSDLMQFYQDKTEPPAQQAADPSASAATTDSETSPVSDAPVIENSPEASAPEVAEPPAQPAPAVSDGAGESIPQEPPAPESTDAAPASAPPQQADSAPTDSESGGTVTTPSPSPGDSGSEQ